jgi:hypothetical protein
VIVDLENPQTEYELEVMGRSHHSGASGELFDDLETITTALHIAESIHVRVVSQ